MDELLAVPKLRRLVPVVILIKSINFFVADSSEFLGWAANKELIQGNREKGKGFLLLPTDKQPGLAGVKWGSGNGL